MRRLPFAIFTCLLTVAMQLASAQNVSETNLWESVDRIPQSQALSEKWVQPEAMRMMQLHHESLRPLLDRAPIESKRRVELSSTLIAMPMPDGKLSRFRFVESPVMAPELAARFPGIKTFVGQGVDDPQAQVRFDITPAGFHAQVLSQRGTVYIEPYLRGGTNYYAVFYKADLHRITDGFRCSSFEKEAAAVPSARVAVASAGSYLRTYRLACATTAEYTRYFGGTVADGLAAVVTAINRINGVFESELAIRFVLVAGNDRIIYTRIGTEPYCNSDALSLLLQNQANLDAVIGSSNYDVGHVFGTQGGGLAMVGVVGVDGLKAQGETGIDPPVGDGFYIDYLAHELGHQFGAHHAFNSTEGDCGGGNRSAATAYEPGSGSTIMSYAGMCGGDNLQKHSDSYFHSASLQEIIEFTTSGAGGSCGVLRPVANETPQVSAGTNFVIPMGTPFTLTANGGDTAGGALTYCWEERDLGPEVSLTAPDDGIGPLFRSVRPTNSPARTFPQWSDILKHTNTPGETLPSTSRTLNFRVTARDGRFGGGAMAFSDMQVTVTSNAGPFVLTSPGSHVTWWGGQTVTWDVGGTADPPINAGYVTIRLSTDGGRSFPIVLATNVPNTGSQFVVLPNVSTAAARIEVQAENNIFFAVSPVNFSIVAVSSELVVGQSVSAPIVNPGSNVTFSIALTNFGPHEVTRVVLRDILPPALEFVSAVPSQGTCAWNHGILNCTLGPMVKGRHAEIVVVATVVAPGPATNMVALSAPRETNYAVVNAVAAPPQLAPIADRTIHAGATLVLANSTANSGGISGALTFSLDPGAPTGAVIDPATGLFTWATGAADANTTRQITVRVTDNASPVLSTTQSFNVTVLPPPSLQRLAFANGAMNVSWSAIAGQIYRVQYKENLADLAWSDLKPDVPASSRVATISDPLVPGGQRFYRILVVP